MTDDSPSLLLAHVLVLPLVVSLFSLHVHSQPPGPACVHISPPGSWKTERVRRCETGHNTSDSCATSRWPTRRSVLAPAAQSPPVVSPEAPLSTQLPARGKAGSPVLLAKITHNTEPLRHLLAKKVGTLIFLHQGGGIRRH